MQSRYGLHLDPLCYGPDKSDHFTCDCSRDDDRRLAGRNQTAISCAKPQLRFPGNVADFLWQRLDAVMQFATDPCLHTIGPSPLDKRTPGLAIAGLGNTSAPDADAG